jgi:hypothetical protein
MKLAATLLRYSSATFAPVLHYGSVFAPVVQYGSVFAPVVQYGSVLRMNNVDKLDMMSVCLYAEELGEE